mgnify:CR=1 FL=1
MILIRNHSLSFKMYFSRYGYYRFWTLVDSVVIMRSFDWLTHELNINFYWWIIFSDNNGRNQGENLKLSTCVITNQKSFNGGLISSKLLLLYNVIAFEVELFKITSVLRASITLILLMNTDIELWFSSRQSLP